MTVKHQLKSIAIGAALFTLGGIGCGGGTSTNDDPGPLGNVESLIILQRPSRNDSGDIFQYTSYKPGARLISLSPPTADGTITPICCDKAGAEFANIDISSYDISFDAKSIVFAGKLSDNERYGLFLLTLADGSVTQIATDPQHDFVSPMFLPGDRVMSRPTRWSSPAPRSTRTSTSAARPSSSAASTSTAPAWRWARATCRTAPRPAWPRMAA
jgi:hypothetical protein